MNQSPNLPTAVLGAVINRANFTAAVEKAVLAIDPSPNAMIMSHLLLTADGSDVIVAGGDLVMEIEVSVEAEADSRFAVAVPHKVLRNMLKKAPASERISFLRHPADVPEDDEAKPNNVVIEELDAVFGRTSYRIETRLASDLLRLEGFGSKPTRFKMAGSALWNMLDAVKDAVSLDETRYYLNGVYLHRDRANLCAVATSGHRLYSQSIEAPAKSEGMPGVIVPTKMVAVLHKLLKGKGAPAHVIVEVDGSQVSVAFDTVRVRSKTIDGTFPDYSRVVPTTFAHAIKLDVGELRAAIEALSAIADDTGLRFDFTEGSLTIARNKISVGRGAVTMDCAWSGEPLTFGVNGSYLSNMIGLACPTGGELDVALNTANDVMRISGTEPGWLGLLMPMKV